MNTFSDAEYNRLAYLESSARLADLEIERTKLKDLANVDVEDLTAGELVTLANVYEAMRVVMDVLTNGLIPGDKAPPAEYVTPSTAERRTFSFDNSSGRYAPTGAAYEPPATPTTKDEERTLAQLREYILDRLKAADQEQTFNTVNGPIKAGDVPRDQDGRINEAWLNANCTCDDHEKARIDKDRAQSGNTPGDPTIAAGLYL